MQMRNLAAMAAIIVATSPCLAGGSPGYYQAPYYAEQPPVVVYTTPPNPIVGIVGGVVRRRSSCSAGSRRPSPRRRSCHASRQTGIFSRARDQRLGQVTGPRPAYPSPPATPPRPLTGRMCHRRGIPAGEGATVRTVPGKATAMGNALIDQELEWWASSLSTATGPPRSMIRLSKSSTPEEPWAPVRLAPQVRDRHSDRRVDDAAGRSLGNRRGHHAVGFSMPSGKKAAGKAVGFFRRVSWTAPAQEGAQGRDGKHKPKEHESEHCQRNDPRISSIELRKNPEMI